MNIYRHPLDYSIGAKYYLLEEKLGIEFKINSKNFFVEEIVKLDNLGFNREKGNYIVFILEKKDIDTFTALHYMKKYLGIPVENFIVLGLKDKDATTKQYVFIKKELVEDNLLREEITEKNSKMRFVGYVLRKPRIHDLVGNVFTIIITNTCNDTYYKLVNMVKKIKQYGLPSYYGYQRFGTKRVNTHLLGKYLVLDRVELFVHELLHGLYPSDDVSIIYRVLGKITSNMIYERIIIKHKDIGKAIDKLKSMLRNLYIDAYTSYLYNLLLNKIIDKYGWNALANDYPTIGCIDFLDKYYKDLMEQELIPGHKLTYFKCWFRKGLFKPSNNHVIRTENSIRYSFVLEKGYYASIVLREIFKEDLIL